MHLLGNCFSALLWEVSILPPWCRYGAQGPKKGAKRSAKSIQKAVSMNIVECAKTIVFTVREAHGQLPRRVRRPPFSRSLKEVLSKGVPGSAWDDFW